MAERLLALVPLAVASKFMGPCETPHLFTCGGGGGPLGWVVWIQGFTKDCQGLQKQGNWGDIVKLTLVAETCCAIV